MGFGDTLGDSIDDQRNRDRRTMKQNRTFGQMNMDPQYRGRKRTGITAGGWNEGWL
jgi:hypothetical protein